MIDALKELGADHELMAPPPLQVLLTFAESEGAKGVNAFIDRLLRNALTHEDREKLMIAYYPEARELSRKSFLTAFAIAAASTLSIGGGALSHHHFNLAREAAPLDRPKHQQTAKAYVSIALPAGALDALALKQYYIYTSRMQEIENSDEFKETLSHLIPVITPLLDALAEKFKQKQSTQRS
jgi:hypothetical protein